MHERGRLSNQDRKWVKETKVGQGKDLEGSNPLKVLYFIIFIARGGVRRKWVTKDEGGNPRIRRESNITLTAEKTSRNL